MEVEVVTIPRHIIIRTYPSIIGRVAVLDPDLPIGERLKIGCRLRQLGYRLIHEFNNERVARFLDALCGVAPLDDLEWMSLDDLELDTYLKCERPHPVMGCAFLYYGNAIVYQLDDSVAFEAKLPNGRFVWHNGVKNVFTPEPPRGKPLSGKAYVWMTLTMNDNFTEYDRYLVMLDALNLKFGVRLYVDLHGSIISSEIRTF